MTKTQFDDLSRSPLIRQIPFDRHAPALIAAEIGGEVSLARFRLPAGEVYQITVPGPEGRPATMVTLWPSIRRVDVVGTGVTVVFTHVFSIDLVPGVEAQFRRSTGECLIVAMTAKVIVRA